MKTFKFLAVMVVALIFLVSLVLIAMSAELSKIKPPPASASQIKPQPIPAHPCPAGWHLKNINSDDSGYSCAPDKPTPLPCTGLWRYYDNGCEVGCAQPAPPKTSKTISLCPAGWHLKNKYGSGYSCAPDKPTPLPCTRYWRYYDNGCEVGCVQPVT